MADTFADDLVAGVVLTDALIGTFAAAGDADLRQNRCFLYHVIGGGTGDWDVPIGGMGAVSAALAAAARAAGAELRTGAEVLAIDTGSTGAETSRAQVGWTDGADEYVATAGHVLVNAAPAVLDRLRGARAGPVAGGSPAQDQPPAGPPAPAAGRDGQPGAGLRRHLPHQPDRHSAPASLR